MAGVGVARQRAEGGRLAALALALLLACLPSASADSRRVEPAASPARPRAASVATAARDPGAATARHAGTPIDPGRPFPPQTADAITAAIREGMTQLGIPGLSLAIGEGGEIRLAAGYGLADLENEVAAGPETVYRLASVSKPITAAAVLRLAEKNLLDLDAPAWTYCPAFPAKPHPVTARQILCHQSGVRHYKPGEQPQVKRYESLTEALALFRDDPLVFEPGTSILYSTYAYSLLGCEIEGATHRSFADVLRDEVFGPAAMTSTQADDARALIPHRAAGYVLTESGELRNSIPADMSCKVPGGGLCGTAPDVARFGQALLGGRIVSRPMLQQMLTPQRTKPGRVTGFGLGLTLTTAQGGKREAWHMGGQERVSTVLYTRPEAGLSIAILANLEGVGTPLVHLARRIGDLVAAERAAR